MIDLNRPESAATAGGDLEASASALVARLGSPALVTEADVAQAVRDRQQIGHAIKSVEEFFKPLKSLAHQLHKALCDRETAILSPLYGLDRRKAGAISEYKAAEDRARRKRERVLADEQRRAREAQAIREAAELERDGEHRIAAAVVAEAIAAPAPVVVLADVTKQIDGLRFRRVWKWRLRNEALVPRPYLMIDEKKLNAHASSMKASAAIPGIEFYCEDVPIR